MLNNPTRFIRTSEGWMYILIFLIWTKPMVHQLYSLIKYVPLLNTIAGRIEYWIIGVVALFAFSAIMRQIKPIDLLFYVLCFVYYNINFLLYPENFEELSANYSFVLICILPMYFAGVCMDFEKYEKVLLFGSLSMLIYTAFMQMYYIPAMNIIDYSNESAHNMSAAYEYLPSIMFFTYYFSKYRTRFILAILLFSFFLLLSLGTRGPIISLVFFLIGYLLLINSTKKTIMIAIFIGVMGMAFEYFSYEVAMFLNGVLGKAGMSTRLTSMFMGDDIGFLDDRNGLITIIMHQLNTGDSFSYGLFGSYRFIENYPHRIYVEMWFTFGYVVGTILFVSLCYLIYKAFRNCVDDYQKVGVLILFCVGFIPLFFSGTFVLQWTFYFAIGYFVRIKRNEHLENISESLDTQYLP